MVEDFPVVPGYVLVELLGFGATGEVWLAREAATGDPVAVKLLRAHDDVQALARIRREATVLASLRHPHVVALRKVLTLERRIALVLDHAGGGSLAQLIAARGRLEPGEVVTFAAPLAEALADLHTRGVVHGDVTPANVLFTLEGRPLLADLGVARIVGEVDGQVDGTEGYVDPAVVLGAALSPASDVYGLAAVCAAALSAGVTEPDRPVGASPLALLLERALDTRPESRPTAAEFAVALYDACPPLPVRLRRPVDDADVVAASARTQRVRRASAAEETAGPTRHRRQPTARPKRLLAGIAAGAAAVALAVSAGLWWAASTEGGSPPALASHPVVSPSAAPAPAGDAGSPVAGSAHWRQVVTELDRRRGTAFATADARLLEDVYVPGSPALAADREALGRLAAEGLRVLGRGLEVERVELVSVDDQQALLIVTDRLPDYRYVDARGREVAAGSGRSSRTFAMTLSRQPAGWVIADIAPDAPDAAS